ncbi:citrate lyase acyl carrier protein [Apibacter muscae]|uniref:Citrate lyase acyl carrier protein n=1 Tax=Apibacter muscae TaxID=2509004 RepID=A0A563DFU8_9FLAO|nr:citrate lyase acyl carrier protein [Apibacter muscae]TWP24350.1 citrate lyase acyl carrier protein [Apibacter muscae]TWP28664.1 citrate lyase acyl carrier protein [Apibacter muscae]TWP30087.1 citrate lyase acyl carrier protein [Apibacter muscae]
MEIVQKAVAGTLESSDIMIRVSPSDELDIVINSTVEAQFGDEILKTVKEILSKLNIDKIKILIDDKGALDCVLRARLITALIRSTKDQTLWEKIQ